MNDVTVPCPPRVVLAGSVTSSLRTLQGLVRHHLAPVGVLGVNVDRSQKISGFVDLERAAEELGIPYLGFDRINDRAVIDRVRAWRPDLLFVVGLSQMVQEELMGIATVGNVGFHPTHLPLGRGRAPLAWITHDLGPGAASFFLMDEGVDSGPILAQEPYVVGPRDIADQVNDRTLAAIDRALDRWLPELAGGHWRPAPQNHAKATYTGIRRPEDGCIDWQASARDIDALIRAASRPHPGAYTYVGGRKLLIWNCAPAEGLPYRGIPGRLLLWDDDRGWLVQTGHGLLWLTEFEFDVEAEDAKEPQLRVGRKLGYAAQDEIHRLRRQNTKLKKQLLDLEQRIRILEEGGTR